MASEINSAPLAQAFGALSKALNRLESAALVASARNNNHASEREQIQAELTTSWQQYCAGIETERGTLADENNFLKHDNLRLSNQLQTLQEEYLALQKTAGHVIQRLDGAISQLDLLKGH